MGEAPGARLFRLDIRIALGREERDCFGEGASRRTEDRKVNPLAKEAYQSSSTCELLFRQDPVGLTEAAGCSSVERR
jgi:hypothetical protein